MSACPHVSDPQGTCPSAPHSYRSGQAGQIGRTDDEWQQRLAEQCAAAVARRRQRKTDRDHHMGARNHGLRQRHERKLSR